MGITASDVLGPFITGGTQIIGQGMANRQNQRMARQQRDWNWEMQNRQNRFNLSMWNAANEYNTPAAQMERFKDAGLNPHLIYGKGTAGNTQPLRSADVKGYTRPEIKSITQGVDIFGDIYRQQNIRAQTENIKEQSETQKTQQDVNTANALLLNNKAIGELFRSGSDMISYKQKHMLFDTYIDTQKRTLEKLNQDIGINQINYEILEGTKKAKIDQAFADLKKTYESTKNLKESTQLLKLKGAYQTYQNKLASQGIYSSDNILFRQMAQGNSEMMMKVGGLVLGQAVLGLFPWSRAAKLGGTAIKGSRLGKYWQKAQKNREIKKLFKD